MTTTAPVSGDMSRLSPALAGAVAAPVGRRVGAYVVDCLAAGGLYSLATVAPLIGLYGASQLETAGLVVTVVVGLIQWGMHASSGQTIGKRLFGLRTVTVAGGLAPGAGRTAGRLLLWDVIALVPIVGFPLVALSVFFDSTGSRRGWHDLASGLVLLDVQQGRDPLAAPSGAGRYATTVGASLPYAPTPPSQAVHPAAAPATDASVPVPAAPVAVAPSPAAPVPLPPVPTLPAPALPEPVLPAPVLPAPALPAPNVPAPASSSLVSSVVSAQGGSVTATGGARAAGGLIAAVPGMAPAAPPAADGAVRPAPSGPAPTGPEPTGPAPTGSAPTGSAPSAPSAPAPAWASGPEDVDQTVLSAPTQRTTSGVRLRFDTGEELEVTGRGLIGRDPQAGDEPLAHRVPLEDRTRSVSKTHLEFRLTDGRLWVRDLHSTNGSRIGSAGTERPLEAGRWVPAETGDVVHLGSRTFTVVAG